MLNIKSSLFTLFIISTTIMFSQTKYIRLDSLPTEALRVVELKYGSWDFFNSPVPYFDSTGVMVAWKYADIIKGDFDNNSKTDYAVLVKPVNKKNGFFIVLLQTQNTYNCLELAKVQYSKAMVLFLIPKDSRLYDFDSESFFTIPNEGITLAHYEKAGTTYFMKEGKFRAYNTSD